jgi:peptide methionine sulfoxide reductase msrA/msrB
MKLFNIILGLAFLFISSISLIACGQNKSADKTSDKTSDKTTSNFSVIKSNEDWKKELSIEQYKVLREKETERPYTGKLLYNKDKGVYKCAGCGNELFTDEMKFDSHCGWPSFDKEIAGGKIKKVEDNSLGMHRTEIVCAKCGGHLGHLFDDGPTATGLRYCVNSESLTFQKEMAVAEATKTKNNIDTITLGGGCYWCVEAVYEMLDGVVSVTSGFSGGTVVNPTYREVCMGTTGHAEVVQIVYDTKKTSLDEILKVFFTVHDPTTLNRQGADEGEQYRSVILYRNNEQYKTAKSIVDELNKRKVYDNPVVTQIVPFNVFYKAEDYHQDYYSQNQEKPYCKMVIQPKLEKFEKLFKDRLKKTGN